MDIKNINYGWKFYKSDCALIEETSSINVNLPHTWNNLDGQDGGNDYYRGVCTYKKVIDLNKLDDKEYYIEFKGVNQIATVYINDELVTTHKGGYSCFRANITNFVKKGINKIAVSVDNRANDIVYPQTADFTFFGGIYRDVNLLCVNKSRFDLDYFGSEGVKVTPNLKGNIGNVEVEFFLTNPLPNEEIAATVRFNDDVIATHLVNASDGKLSFAINNPHIWDGVEAPNVYTLTLNLLEDKVSIDERSVSFGFRNFEVTKDGFFLNGRKYALNGVSRHQDRLDMGYAITKKEHEEDMALIKEMGTTSIRLAHYQHDDYFYHLCDINGMVVWAEIPYISVHMENGHDNALQQMQELVVQQYNHPSICFWGISNEITIGGESESQVKLHHELNDLVKSLDNTRLTTLACLTMCDTHSPLTSITDVISYNHYFGWYIGETKDNGTWLDDFRSEFSDKPIGLSEYGCEANLRLHSSSPTKGDYSEEYQCCYHEEMLEIFKERPFLWSTYCWNMFDFGVDSRDEGDSKGRNNKGLVTYDRKTKKDSFYLYKAYWSKEPFVHICSKRYTYRAGKEMTIKVYSNCKEVSLYVNNKLVETKTGEHVFTFVIKNGFRTNVKAVAGELNDTATFKKTLKEKKCYHLKKEKKKVENWFMKDGVKYEFKYPKDKFSIKDKFNTIYKEEEGKKVLLSLIEMALKQMSPDGDHDPEKFLKSTRKLIGGMTIERIANFAGDKISMDLLYYVNTELNKIDKPLD